MVHFEFFETKGDIPREKGKRILWEERSIWETEPLLKEKKKRVKSNRGSFFPFPPSNLLPSHDFLYK